MIRSSLNIFFLLSLIFILNSCSPQTDFEVNQGVIDLQNFDFKSSPAVSLKGEWEFYPEQLLEPEDFINNQIENKLYMYVPQSWDKSSKLPNQKAFGYGTYRLKVLLPDEIDFQPGFNPGQPATSYRLWINGEFLSSSGEVGTNPSESVPFLKPDIVPFEHKKGEIEIILQVSNYTRQVGGLWKAVHIGNAEEMNYFLSLNIATQLMFAGIFLFIAVQYFSFYIMRIRDTINLVFSILSFAFFMNALNLGEHPLLIFFPDLPHGLLWKFTFSSAVLYVSLLLWFSRLLYPENWSRHLTFILLTVSSIIFLITILTPAVVFSRVVSFYFPIAMMTIALSVIKAIAAIVEKRSYAKLNFIALLILAAALTNDILHNRSMISTAYFTTYGFLALALAYSYIMNRRHSDFANKSLSISKNMLRMKESEFQSAAARTLFLSKISQEYRVPTNAILEMAQALKDSGASKEQAEITDSIIKTGRGLLHTIANTEDLLLTDTDQKEEDKENETKGHPEANIIPEGKEQKS